MAKKYYAVKVGRSTGIFETWDECKASVDGYPGALYKSFKDISDAYTYMDWSGEQISLFDMETLSTDNDDSDPMSSLVIHETPDTDRPFSNAIKAVSYVDGSYNEATKYFSYGCVMFFNGEEIHLSDSFNDEELASMRNVAGEIFGSMAAMEYAIKHGARSLTIYHDYSGIEKWCTGEWKASKPGTIAYKKFYEKAKKRIEIKFEKVKGHSGDKYNDLADELAKKACGI